jgi:UDP-2,4-diacetamido-2,4,6-trideoxy-beta-L-altropyranose hydrolase
VKDLCTRVFFRADGNSTIGLGHLVRCCSLAHMLKDNFEISFICKNIPDYLLIELKSFGINCFIIENESDFFNKILTNSIVVIDGYHFDTTYQKQIKSKGVILVCIDDLHDTEFVADLIINHTPGVTPQDYNAKPYTQYALGLDYVLLRPLFLEQAKKKRINKKIESSMICFGGSDFKNLTQSSLSVVLEFSQLKKIIVVTGAEYELALSFKKLVDSDTRIDHRHVLNEKQMLDTMLEADLAIVPSSTILLEAMAAGCKIISGIYIDNQKFIYESFKNSNSFVDAGSFLRNNLHSAISEVLGECKNIVRFIDGNSALRVSKLFDLLKKEFLINLRAITINDLELTFLWASNPEIRRFSFHSHQITKQEHIDWLFKKYTDINCYYAIVECNSVPIGSIRFDIKDGEAMISYLLDPAFHGRGFGQILLKKGIEWLLNVYKQDLTPVNRISGQVMKTNIPSIKAFERLGFVMKEQMEYYKFEKRI